MANKMLIDAAHPEETRVVVIRGNRVEEFDYESTFRKQLRGNIYLAKITRVEPSLQAAFVDYGGNRHGFLAFNEIHPDYYQIPESDKKAMLKAEAEEEARWAQKQKEALEKRNKKNRPVIQELSKDDPAYDLVELFFTSPKMVNGKPYFGEDGMDVVEIFADGTDVSEMPPSRPRIKRKHYRIQEVIKRNQIILIQVSKEERGNKGAALTTYLSLAGRFTVLMPNTERGGGISRKIETGADRKRLRDVMEELSIPEGMGLIIRTAGASKTKLEVKRDYDYLLRLWESIRKLTLKSSAPALTYEEGNLIKRSVRDLYDKDIDEILVSGEQPHKEAKSFMQTLMPSHAKNVKLYKDHEPIFMRHQVERQLNAMFSPFVTLKSGGYIVINQTEALVAIDVNSGKSTKEKSIEETALATNLEAADEIARQLRLRDMAGLIVIDYIDMNERRNNRSVEKKTKECLRHDRARIQVGRISSFGLMEMSRQRMRTGVLEGSTTPCEHCQGTGMIRSTESVALYVLRSLEDILMNGGTSDGLNAITSVDVALYILNHKRDYLQKLEDKYDCAMMITANAQLLGANFSIEKLGQEGNSNNKDNVVVQVDWAQTAPKQQRTPVNKRNDSRNNKRNTAAKARPDKRKASNESKAEGSNTKENNRRPRKSASETKKPVSASADQTGKTAPAKQEKTANPRRRQRTPANQTRNKASEDRADAAADTPSETSQTEAQVQATTDNQAEQKKPRRGRPPRRGPRKKDTTEVAATSASEAIPEQKSDTKTAPAPQKSSSKEKVSAKTDGAKPVADVKIEAKAEVVTLSEKADKVKMADSKTSKPAVEEKVVPKKRGWWSGTS